MQFTWRLEVKMWPTAIIFGRSTGKFMVLRTESCVPRGPVGHGASQGVLNFVSQARSLATKRSVDTVIHSGVGCNGMGVLVGIHG